MSCRLSLIVTITILASAAACGDSGLATSPTAHAPSFQGGGGTPPVTTTPTVSISSAGLLTPPLVGQQIGLSVLAVSESGNRTAPALTVTGAPAGFTPISLVTVDGPHGGGPGYTQAQYAWTPTSDQIGLAPSITVIATTSGGSSSATATFSAVLDAPSALTGLSVAIVGDHIEARWVPSINGAAPISYVVSACYRNENIRPVVSTCDVITTTTDNSALGIPLTNPSPTVAPSGGVATYFVVIVKPVDAAGHAGPQASAFVP